MVHQTWFSPTSKALTIFTNASIAHFSIVSVQRNIRTPARISYYDRQDLIQDEIFNPREVEMEHWWKKAHAVIFALKWFGFLIWHARFKTQLYTDHHIFLYILAPGYRHLTGYSESRVSRWSAALTSSSVDVKHIPGKHDIVADLLTRWGIPQAISVMCIKCNGEMVNAHVNVRVLLTTKLAWASRQQRKGMKWTIDLA